MDNENVKSRFNELLLLSTSSGSGSDDNNKAVVIAITTTSTSRRHNNSSSSSSSSNNIGGGGSDNNNVAGLSTTNNNNNDDDDSSPGVSCNRRRVMTRKEVNLEILKIKSVLTESRSDQNQKRCRKGKTKPPKLYYLLNKYNISENGETLVDKKSGRVYVAFEDIFETISKSHVACGHGGELRTLQHLKHTENVYNITLHHVKTFLSLCEKCVLKRSEPKKTNIPIKPIISKRFGERMQADLIDLSTHKTNHSSRYILNIQDHLTKFCLLRAIPNKSATTICPILVEVFSTFGPPQILQTDNGNEFTSSIIRDTLKKEFPHVKIVHGRPRHPQSQGSIERANCDVMNIMKCCLADNKESDWVKVLPMVQLQKNSAYNRSIKCSPFFAVFGQNPHGSGGFDDDDDVDDDDDHTNNIQEEEDMLSNDDDLFQTQHDGGGDGDNNYYDNDLNINVINNDDDDVISITCINANEAAEPTEPAVTLAESTEPAAVTLLPPPNSTLKTIISITTNNNNVAPTATPALPEEKVAATVSPPDEEVAATTTTTTTSLATTAVASVTNTSKNLQTVRKRVAADLLISAQNMIKKRKLAANSLSPIPIGSYVTVHLSKFDIFHKLSFPNILGKVIEYYPAIQKYRVQSLYNNIIIKELLSLDQLQICKNITTKCFNHEIDTNILIGSDSQMMTTTNTTTTTTTPSPPFVSTAAAANTTTTTTTTAVVVIADTAATDHNQKKNDERNNNNRCFDKSRNTHNNHVTASTSTPHSSSASSSLRSSAPSSVVISTSTAVTTNNNTTTTTCTNSSSLSTNIIDPTLNPVVTLKRLNLYPLRTVAKLEAEKFIGCLCLGRCSNTKCKCKKTGRLCINDLCHRKGKNSICINKQ